MINNLKSYFLARVIPPRRLIIGLAVLSVLGLIDAIYLTNVHYSGSAVICSVFKGCDKVLSSPYATLLGFPLALLGLFYYLTVLILILALHYLKRWGNTLLIFLLTSCGFLFSLYLVYLQFFVIRALCPYCLLSAGISTLLFLLSGVTFKLGKLSADSGLIGPK